MTPESKQPGHSADTVKLQEDEDHRLLALAWEASTLANRRLSSAGHGFTRKLHALGNAPVNTPGQVALSGFPRLKNGL